MMIPKIAEQVGNHILGHIFVAHPTERIAEQSQVVFAIDLLKGLLSVWLHWVRDEMLFT
jgi:hypothetical protein